MSGSFYTPFCKRMKECGTVVKPTDNIDLIATQHEDISSAIHQDYLAAGARLIKTPTLYAQHISQAHFQTDHLIRDINTDAYRITRRAIGDSPDRGTRLVGVIGTTHLSITRGNISPTTLHLSYSTQVETLLYEGVDVFLIDNVTDLRNGEEAVYAILEAFNRSGIKKPIILSAVTDERGKLPSGHMLHLTPVKEDISAWGIVCPSAQIAHMYGTIDRLHEAAPIAVALTPNATITTYGSTYTTPPKAYTEALIPYVANGFVDIIGGGEGTTPEYIQEVAKLL